MNDTAPAPRVLLVEDDPVSRSFLQAVLESAAAQVATAETAQAALLHARGQAFDLWLIDANLPDMRGEALLSSLRAHWPGAVALAHTADSSADMRRRLLAAGFAEVLVKPLAPGALLQALARYLAVHPDPSPMMLPDWDRRAAIRALNGQETHLDALRGLFLGELPAVRRAVRDAVARGDEAALRQQVHRLLASCGFVGAARLAAAARALQAAPGTTRRLEEFDRAADTLLQGGP
ncbi:response regulator [Xanthomonas massiliensis]|uniref:response regulator n=1 Tax=Xanthomonas massiliensis TaxID=1720302 RepID=UPI000824F2CC|nr:response regulator [Xanthomonas massiliensis]